MERAWKNGFTATCNVGGAGNWSSDLNKYLVGRTVCIVPDNDEAGSNHAKKVQASLRSYDIDCFIFWDYCGDLDEKGDFSDWMDINSNDFEFKGYIEGNHIMDGDVNIIVTDGFTGNVALKTAEGTANFITKEIKKNMTSGIIGKILTLLNYKNLMRFKKRLDPRLYNGAIFIGLNSPVIKSHGSTDSVGFSYSLDVCKKIIKGNLINKIKMNIK